MAESRENVTNAVAGDIIGFTILVLIRWRYFDSWQNKFEFEPSQP